MSEPRKIFLGSVTIDDGVSPAFDIPEGLTAEQIIERLEAIEAKRATEAVEETRRLRAMFLPEGEKADDK